MALFAAPGSSSRSSSKNLAEFRAGKMFMEGKMVKPDKRKGLVYVHQSDDGLMHFCWKDRTSGKVEDDLIIFPDDCEFKKVTQCTTGRVYILKFKASSRKFFFWIQEPKTDKDEDNCKKVNESLNNPPTPGQSSGNDLPGLDQLGQGNFQDMLQNMDNNQLLQLMAAGGGMGGNLGSLSSLLGAAASGGRTRQARSQATTSSTRTTTRPATTTAVTTDRAAERSSAASVTPTPAPAPVTPTPATPATPSNPPQSATADVAGTPGLQLSQLQNILSQMGMQGQGAAGGEEPVDLSKAVTSEVMIPILANPEVQERLKPFLPQGESLPPTAEELKATVKSPQFRQAMSSFSEALATGQLAPVLKQFGLPESAQEAAAKGDVEGFAKSMQDSEAKPDEKIKKEEEEEEKMVVE